MTDKTDPPAAQTPDPKAAEPKPKPPPASKPAAAAKREDRSKIPGSKKLSVMTEPQLRAVARRQGLPDGRAKAELIRMLESRRRGGDERFVRNYTMCRLCRGPCRSRGSDFVDGVSIHHLECQRCHYRFKIAEAVR